jgi:hypothetical protein
MKWIDCNVTLTIGVYKIPAVNFRRMGYGSTTIAAGVKLITLSDLRRPNHGCENVTSISKENAANYS